jgi:phage baseplate assembly protein V
MNNIARVIAKLTAPLARRVRLAARRAVVRLVYDDPKMQELQLSIFSGEVRDHVERWEDYGLTSYPLSGAEALVLALGGSSEHSAVVKVADRRYRPAGLVEGEVVLYDDQGQQLHFKRDRLLHLLGVDTLALDVAVAATLTAPEINLGGDAASVRALIDERFKILFDAHTHSGVTAGPGVTGAPALPLELAACATTVTKAL